MLSAFSVAAFIATIRAICSLTAASRKHLNNRTLKLVGTTSSKMLAAEGRNSYCGSLCRRFLAGAGQIAQRQQRLDDRLLTAGALELRVGHVEPVEARHR